MQFLDQSLTVIVPTLWKVDSFPKSIIALAENKVVSHIIVIDNNPARSVPLPHPKIKVLSKGFNIYVNPAWNLGVANTTSRYACLLNDDIDATEELLEYAVSILNNEESVGLIGMGWASKEKVLRHRTVEQRENAFGAAMFFRTKEYYPIPNQLKIWCGDDYLMLRFQLQGKQIVEISGFGHVESIQFSKTVNSDKEGYKPILKRDLKLWHSLYERLLLVRYRPIRTIFGGMRAKIIRIFFSGLINRQKR